jgi:hypothetical protein
MDKCRFFLVVLTWIFVKFWTELLFPFLVIIDVLFVLQNETKSTKNKVVRPHGTKNIYITLKIK